MGIRTKGDFSTPEINVDNNTTPYFAIMSHNYNFSNTSKMMYKRYRSSTVPSILGLS